MTVELAGVFALLLVSTALGLSVGLALIGSSMVGLALLVGAGNLTDLVGGPVVNALTTYTVLAAALLIVLGALLEHTGVVLGLPAQPAGRRDDPDRAAYFAGGALGVPLPASAALILVAILFEISIGRVVIAALLPGLVLSALYLLIFGLARMVRAAPLELGVAPEQGGGKVTAIVFRCLVPVLCMLVFFAPIQSGVMTPTEAAALVVIVGLIFVLVLILVSRRAQAGAWPGLSAGVSAAGVFLLILIGLTLFGQVMALGQVARHVSEAVSPLGLDGHALLGLAVVAALIVGTILGPLAGIGVTGAATYGLLVAAGTDQVVIGVVFFLTAEAIRVGPRLWRGGFLRQGGDLGNWLNYLAALAVIAGYIVLFK